MHWHRLTLYACAAGWLLGSVPSGAMADDKADPHAGRFTPLEGFEVQEVVKPGSTGSLVAMAFDEEGGIIASRERGPLLRIRDEDGDGTFESVATFCDKVSNCQGILPLGEYVFAVGDGPSKTALYRLSDPDGDGVAEKVDTLFKFKGGMGEHGPHAPILGPDGLLYVMLGNHTFVEGSVAETSPHHHFYDGELIQPKYEDANGHASGVKAPGGTVVRTDTDGSFIELFLGGFRNAYDHAFNRDGELFTYDSDMEWDVGLPWYRPTRVNHLIPGAEFGWRSGWSKWPRYYVDSLPETMDIGRGSPTGVVFYDHDRFGQKYQGAFFMCDWSQGRVVAVSLEPDGGTYRGRSEIFLQGQPLNCSDIDVGPDGWLYISVGGRNTEGSIFRVVASDAKPPAEVGEHGIGRAIRQPQLGSAWARRNVRDVKKELGDQWGPGLVAVAVNTDAAQSDRVRALNLMQQLGPQPSNDLLVTLSADDDAALRAKVTYLMGIHTSDVSNGRLIELLDDSDPVVRRRACEALVRSRHPGPVDKLLRIAAEPQPFVSWAARRALEQLPRQQWKSAVLNATDVRVFIVGCVALEVLGVDKTTAGSILAQAHGWLEKELSNDDLVGLLRVIELAIHQGEYTGEEISQLRAEISKRFPSDDDRVNRELIRTLVMLDDPTLAPRVVEYLRGNASIEERIQAAMLARFLKRGWTPESRGKLLDFFAIARAREGGNSYRGYLQNGANDVLKAMPPEEQLARIRDGVNDPVRALGVVRNLSGRLTDEQVTALRELDRALEGNDSPPARELADAALTALGYGNEAAADYLGEVFEASPGRRHVAAGALANFAAKQNKRRPADWDRLVRSLSVVEGSTAREVLRALSRFGKKHDKPQDLRQVILTGLKLKDQGGRDAVVVLTRWTREKIVEPRGPWEQTLGAWQKWFAEKHPDQPEAVLPVEAEGAKWSYAELLEFLTSESGRNGNAQRGELVFEKSQCIKCHRYGARGEGIGPDLSNVARRFQRKEILQSVIFPSQVISDQFAAKTVITTDGRTHTGLVGPTADGVVVLQANAEKVAIAKDDIESIVPSKLSAMPEGLFNELTLEEIADLFAFMAEPAESK